MTKLPLKESLFLGFCAALLVITKAALRWHLGISGHAMLLAVFFLLLARGCVPFRTAASVTGLLAGISAAMLGMGKGGPLVIGKFLLPALGVDFGALVLPWLFESYLLCALVGMLAGATKFFGSIAIDLLVGMEPAIAWRHSLLEAAAAMVFGAVGGLCVPPVLRRLRAYGVISPQLQKESS
ncbi:MAG TPA: hypothetical protein VJ995_08085 [Geothermobacteraceae bacterium]|nr:hypothetical protein [Geothermobacteraceae bacterium]